MSRHLFFFLSWVAVVFSSTQVLLAQNESSILGGEHNDIKTHDMLRIYLRELAHEALDRRLTRYEDLNTIEQIEQYQKSQRDFFIDQLGGLPDRTPLNVQTVGRYPLDGCVVEKLIFESRPNFFVTALLYLPCGKAPYPGVLFPCGHSSEGKAADTYQRACLLLAKCGMAVLCYDPIGQGERYQLLSEEGERRFGPTGEHNVAGVAPILLGESLATYMIWDGMRAIDVLCQRDEVDERRIGCTGNSGGGNLTSYLMALDDRIVCAAPGNFITTTRRKNDRPGPGDAEQNIHGQIAFGMDHPDYLLMRAPRPTLILAATRDFVPIEGTWEAFRQAKRIYSRLGNSQQVDLLESDDKHGYTPALREDCARWMRRWLIGEDRRVNESTIETPQPRETWCAPQGKVSKLPGARSIFELYQQKSRQLAMERGVWQERHGRESFAKTVRDIAKVRPLRDIPTPQVKTAQSKSDHGLRVDELIMYPEKGREIWLPAILYRPQRVTGEPCLIVSDQGMNELKGRISEIVKDGRMAMTVDVRGLGETEGKPWRFGKSGVTGPNQAEFFVAYMLGRSLLGMRAEDILAAGRWLSQQQPGKKVRLIAIGETGPPALHAAALAPELFGSLRLEQSLASWQSVIDTPVTNRQYANAVHGALRKYDLPDLVRMFGKDRVTVVAPVDARRETLPIVDTDSSAGR